MGLTSRGMSLAMKILALQELGLLIQCRPLVLQNYYRWFPAILIV
jgi:hypothetical protein